ncbi:MAG TPA: GTPase, partial [Kiloniellales bacterium]
TKAAVVVKDQLFATLDPTMRRVRLPSGTQVIVSDTVGFISDLPTDLVAAFRATLEEVVEADLILHVRDISHRDSDAQRQDVLAVLQAMGLGEALAHGVIEVLNKIDLLDAESRTALLGRSERVDQQTACSAVTGEGIEALLALIDRYFAEFRELTDISVLLSDGAAIAWLYDHGHVLKRYDDDERAHLSVRLDAADLARFRRRHGGAEPTT